MSEAMEFETEEGDVHDANRRAGLAKSILEDESVRAKASGRVQLISRARMQAVVRVGSNASRVGTACEQSALAYAQRG